MTTEPQGIILGQKYRDTISGIEGTATAKFIYLYGCVRINLEYLKDGKIETEVFDEQRLEPLDAAQTIQPEATSGGYRPTPPRR